MIRLLLVDDHPVVRTGYARFIELQGDIQVVAEASCVDSGYQAYLEHAPDVTLCDISLPKVGGMELLRKILQKQPGARVLMCSMHDSPQLVRSALENGAAGFVTKSDSPENLIAAIRNVHSGQTYVSPGLMIPHATHVTQDEAHRIANLSLRELEIWRLLASGLSTTECAQRLNLSPKTVANNQTTIKEKLAASNTAALVHLAQRHGLIEPQ